MKPYPEYTEQHTALVQSDEWRALVRHQREARHWHLRDIFAEDPGRAESFSIDLDGLCFDYSKHLVSKQTMDLLCGFARAVGLEESIHALFSGEPVNFTEQRSAMHMALRMPEDNHLTVDGVDISAQVQIQLKKMRRFVEKVHSGEWTGHTGKPVDTVVNIGIGGSHLGPEMVVNALAPYRRKDLKIYFLANLDVDDTGQLLSSLNPETTLFIIVSKSFSTLETKLNAELAKEWLLTKIGVENAVKSHFVAISSQVERATAFGIDADSIFRMWDWVGGRYSLWSAVGLSIALGIGMKKYNELLAGAYDIDCHLQKQPFESNIPVIMGLLGVWYRNFFGIQSHAVVPYLENLKFLVPYLQQADMESNGKQIDRDGKRVDYATGPVVWGGTGCNSQHAFFQALHQGTDVIPVDFIAAISGHTDLGEHQTQLLANCLAQSRALMLGCTSQEVRLKMEFANADFDEIQRLVMHRSFPGNRPSSTLLLDKLTPRRLGNLLALYEHKIFVQGCLWRINSYDQWGVELGKELAGEISATLSGQESSRAYDSSTQRLMTRIQQGRKR